MWNRILFSWPILCLKKYLLLEVIWALLSVTSFPKTSMATEYFGVLLTRTSPFPLNKQMSEQKHKILLSAEFYF